MNPELAGPSGWEIAGQVANMITAGAAAFAAWHAWRGLSAWRDEAIGRRKAELAEDVLSGFYQVSDAFRAIRAPFSYPDVESKDRPREEGESEEEAQNQDALYVPIARIEKRSEFLRDLMTKRYRMKAFFGADVDGPFDAVNQSVGEIQNAANMMLRLSQPGFDRAKNADLWRRCEETIWQGYGEPDKIEARIEQAIKDMEDICRPLLEGRK